MALPGPLFGDFMTKLAANLSMMFGEVPFLDRFAAAADAGFKAVEFLFPYEASADEVAQRAWNANVEAVLFNFPAGDWNAGERGIAALPDRVEEFREGAQRALDYATATGCSRLHLMAGKTAATATTRATFVENIRYAADLVAKAGITVMLEPLNTKVDMPGYFYDTTTAALAIIDEVARPNVMLQYDIYHMQIMEGDLARTIEQLLPRIGHIQLADNPGRGEPGSGEINYPWLLDKLRQLGYPGWIGCEYRPAAGTTAGLGWAEPYL